MLYKRSSFKHSSLNIWSQAPPDEDLMALIFHSGATDPHQRNRGRNSLKMLENDTWTDQLAQRRAAELGLHTHRCTHGATAFSGKNFIDLQELHKTNTAALK